MNETDLKDALAEWGDVLGGKKDKQKDEDDEEFQW
jgi:hypothetical protein